MPIAGNVTNRIMHLKPVKYLTNPKASSAVGTIAIISGLSKDVINCYYYVTQSLKNEKIPEEKRKFVASLDLSNGILNVITQLAIGIPLVKLTDKVFDSKIAKYFTDKETDKIFKSIKTQTSYDKIYEIAQKNKSLAKAGFAALIALVGTQIVAKRIIVPLIATPMASFFKNKMNSSPSSDPKIAVDNSSNSQKTVPECFKNLA